MAGIRLRGSVWLVPPLAVALGGLLVAPAALAGAPAPRFTVPVRLTGATGGEPSIALDRHGDVYVDGPQGIPAGVNQEPGVGFWRSTNEGTSFFPAEHIGSFAGGGDSDVITAPNGTVYVDDLEAAATDVCKSTNRGVSFTSIGPVADPTHCSALNTGQAGPSDDRPWLTVDRTGVLYLTYHEKVSAQPLIFRDDHGGADDFTDGPCGSIVTSPAIEAEVPTDITGGTLVSKPVTDAAGNLYVLFTTTTQQENAAAAAAGQPSGTFSQVYLAVSRNHCQSFTDYTVFDGAARYGTNDVQFGDIFNALTIDGAGNLYAVAAGFVGHVPFATTANIYLFRSTDHGVHWSGPLELGPAGAHMLPAAAAGPKAGQLAIGYFRTVNGVTNPDSTSGAWTYGTAESTDATAANPRWRYADVRPGFLYHRGDICNLGILCGLIPGQPSDRSLLDFTSAAIDAQGCPLFTFAGNPAGDAAGTYNYVSRQLTGCFSVPTPAGTGGTRRAVAGPSPTVSARPSESVSSVASTTSSGTLADTGLPATIPLTALALAGLAAAGLVASGRRRRQADEG